MHIIENKLTLLRSGAETLKIGPQGPPFKVLPPLHFAEGFFVPEL